MLKKVSVPLFLIIIYITLWYAAALFEHANFASLWYAPAGLTVAILLLWKDSGFLKVWLCVFFVSILTQYSYFDSSSLLSVLLISTVVAFGHTLPYWVAIVGHGKLCRLLGNTATDSFLGPILYPIFLLLGSLGAATLGIGVQISFAEMPVSVGQEIWMSWWIGDYVGALVLAPFFVFIGASYFGSFVNPRQSFLVHYSSNKFLLPKGLLPSLCWLSIIMIPALIIISRVVFDAWIPVVLIFFITLLPIAILAPRSNWGVMVSAAVLSSIAIILSVKLFGMTGNLVEYQVELLAMTVTILYFYHFVHSFQNRTQELLEAERSLGTMSRLFVLNEVSANIAHEMSTPLQAALSSSQRVRRRLEKLEGNWSVEVDELRHTGTAIEQAGKTLDSVRNLMKSNDLSDVSCKVENAMSTAVSLIEEMTSEQNIQLKMSGIHHLPLVEMDQNELIQILMNLVLNSINSLESAARQEKQIIVSGFLKQETVDLTLHDTGSGVEDPALRQLFMAGSSSTSSGLGLGLWVSKSIAQRRGGELCYIKEDDGSWHFKLTLKCKAVPA